MADIGLSVDIYSSNYYRQGKDEEETKLPIRWMALESIMDGVYTEKTDARADPGGGGGGGGGWGGPNKKTKSNT